MKLLVSGDPLFLSGVEVRVQYSLYASISTCLEEGLQQSFLPHLIQPAANAQLAVIYGISHEPHYKTLHVHPRQGICFIC